MLQQTQVATVRDRFYSPFMKRFPTIRSLAEADEQAVMKAWEGLGYYRRARHLHMAAQQSIEGMPQTVEGLMALPGIGQSTAHAIAAFAYRHPAPVLDANVRRVLARFFALTDPSVKEWWQAAWALLDTEHPDDYNQAMMDIGAMICTPRQPACGLCPLSSQCKGKENPGAYPLPKARKSTPTRRMIWLVITDDAGNIAMWKRDEAHLGGLYRVHHLPPEAPIGPSWKKLGSIKQVYSHYTLLADAYMIGKGDAQVLPAHAQWVTLPAARRLPSSKAEHKLFALLENAETAQRR